MSETQTPPEPEEDPTAVDPAEEEVADEDSDAPEGLPDELEDEKAEKLKEMPDDEGDAGQAGAERT